MSLAKALEIENGLKMPLSVRHVLRGAISLTNLTVRTRAAFDTALGTALVHFYPPKHHVKALTLLESVLEAAPESIACLSGRGYIREEAGQWESARSDFEQVVALTSEVDLLRLEAREQAAWCQVQEGSLIEGASRLADVAAELVDRKDKAVESARVWWKLGQAEWLQGGDCARTVSRDTVLMERPQATTAMWHTSTG